jgi:hypothetical protein
MAGDTRKLKLLDAFDAAASDMGDDAPNTVGYQKVDDLTVLERKLLPVLTMPGYTDHIVVQADVYDFNNFSVTHYALAYGNDNVFQPPVRENFSAIEGKQCIRDAHRALVELGGAPRPLDEIMDYIMELRSDVSISAPLKLKAGPAKPQNS